MLSVNALETYYGTSQALFGLSLEVNSGEMVTLLGRNGMGKTTTINTIMGIITCRRGTIDFENHRLSGLKAYQIAQRGLGLVPEGRQVFPNLTVWENLVATAANRSKQTAPWTVERIFGLFPELSERQHQMGNLLSGGEQQMLAIGRALMTNPKLLLLDEATEGLAPMIRQEIWNCLATLKNEGLSILVIDKNIDDLARIADRHYIIEKGRVVWQGDSSALLTHTDITQRYLGV